MPVLAPVELTGGGTYKGATHRSFPTKKSLVVGHTVSSKRISVGLGRLPWAGSNSLQYDPKGPTTNRTRTLNFYTGDH